MEKIWLKKYEPGIRPHLEYPNAPLYSFLDATVSKYPDRKAIVFGAVAHKLPGQPLLDGSMTYREL